MSYLKSVCSKHTIGPRAVQAFSEINKIPRRDEVIEYITSNLKKQIDSSLIKDFADLLMSRSKWSAPRLLRVWECSPLRKLFLLHLAVNHPQYEPHRGSRWMINCIQVGDERRQRCVVGMVQRTLALEELAGLGLDIKSLDH